MDYKAPRRYYSHGVVARQQDFATDIVTRRRPYVPYDRPNKFSRSLVWTSKEYKSPEGNNMPRTNDVSPKPPVLGLARKNAACGPMRSSSLRKWVCKYWKDGKCKRGEQCQFLHSWSCFPGLAMVASLEGHNKELKGIALPEGSDKLFSVSIDGTLRVWDCNSGQCVHSINLEAEAGSLISEGPWVFLGLPNAIKAFNVQTSQDLHLQAAGVVGQVNAMTIANRMLFAGTSSGSILVWKATTDSESDPFKYLTSLEGHSGEVTCFAVGGQMLYSGSVDKTIKMWDLNTLQCIMTLKQHTGTVTSLLCWDKCLISSSLDGTIKVWAYSENGILKVVQTRRQEQSSVHALSGMHDAEAKPIIFCSYQNGIVGIFDLPSFQERGRMFSTHTIATLTIGPQGLLFSGDESGNLRVWTLAAGNKV
ncbi:WD40-repeat-containing domain superfamily [Arabidopsis suecica]|uniref:WD40-repeat-containing domain superfamily n=1 Tax=Arabidopsis suecica TaxID=45249 RepID=A0A8T2DPH1_ARASU|nr:WD40-repeat-containing domain superfamily [Arabidopsis suecica]